MKPIAVFLGIFIFVNICGAYIMGGFYNQTIISKFIGSLLGALIGLACMLPFIDEKKNK